MLMFLKIILPILSQRLKLKSSSNTMVILGKTIDGKNVYHIAVNKIIRLFTMEVLFYKVNDKILRMEIDRSEWLSSQLIV